MKSNILAILAFLVAFTFPSFATEHNVYGGASPYYLKFEAGYTSGIDFSGTFSDGSTYEEKVDDFTVFGFGIGGYSSANTRYEILGNYIKAGDRSFTINGGLIPTDTDDDYFLSLSVNAYRDFMSSERFRPYIGGGVGLAEYEFSGTINLNGTTYSVQNDDTALGVNAGVGVCIIFSENSCVELGYRANYFAFEDTDIIHEGRIGIRLSGF